ncbi:hypothetical protein SARI_03124 [Salmonella enterica subsp. arizonae serovar 62:z4,z23:-]|uniref:Uncharacterized protein n=1 Tax=Salmonella arizonae (strain ATCC BAA-731 / CDC346-86 / RSK2980) TaxID=41514 RepID=A9MS62_SALAR|nr:hypothetical protein SARI_03124 [Salmonella enterica subsp. arizonae serovar 62:z4,z23:-]
MLQIILKNGFNQLSSIRPKTSLCMSLRNIIMVNFLDVKCIASMNNKTNISIQFTIGYTDI